ncbi:MAG: hypothetical protein ACXWYS_03095 [Gaiellaceae bacterium]
MFPFIVFGVVALLVLVLGFGLMRSRNRAEHPAGETNADRAEIEREFEAAERYQEEWREEQHKHRDDTLIP